MRLKDIPVVANPKWVIETLAHYAAAGGLYFLGATILIEVAGFPNPSLLEILALGAGDLLVMIGLVVWIWVFIHSVQEAFHWLGAYFDKLALLKTGAVLLLYFLAMLLLSFFTFIFIGHDKGLIS